MNSSKIVKMAISSMLITPALSFANTSSYTAQILLSDGSVNYLDVSSFRVELDTPKLALILPAVQSVREATIALQPGNGVYVDSIIIQAADSSLPYTKWTISKASISSYSLIGGENGIASENVTMTFEAVKVDYSDRGSSYDCSKKACIPTTNETTSGLFIDKNRDDVFSDADSFMATIDKSIGRITANPGDDGLKDEYCSNDPDDSYPPCDDGFEKACKEDGGHMSGPQDWGGKTCFKPF